VKVPELSRRNFLKTSALGAAVTGAGAAGMLSLSGWLEEASADEGPQERVAYTYHQGHCSGRCSLKCTVRDGRLALIEPNDGFEDDRYSVCCLKGLSEVQQVYSTSRIQTPLKRVGERGSGEFVSITWDEAVSTIAERIKALHGEHGKESVHMLGCGEAGFLSLGTLLETNPGGSSGSIDMGTGNGVDPALGGFGFMSAVNEGRDWVNSRFMLFAGTNYLESNLVFGRAFFEAKEAGCEIIVADPHFSTTASKADSWLPIVPGTDGALFLGMISEILDKHLYDEEFMRTYTSFLFLVSKKDGSLLSSPIDEIGPMGAPLFDFKVWDQESRSPQSYKADGVVPALEGSWMIDGEEYATVFSLLKENQKQYPVSWASTTTGIDEEAIRDVARKYAQGPSALALGMGGFDKLSNADTIGHAAVTLVALTGNIGKPGAFIGMPYGGNGRGAYFPSWPVPKEFKASGSSYDFDLRTEPNSIKAVIALGDAFQQKFANMNKTIAWFQELDFIVVIDIYSTTISQYADIVLPACSKFECDEEYGGVVSSYNYIRLREKVLDPLFESKTDFQIERMLAAAFGLEAHLPTSYEEYIHYCLAGYTEMTKNSVTLQDLAAHQGVLPLPDIEAPSISYSDLTFSTASQRIDIYYESLVEDGQALPNFELPMEVYEDNPLRSSYPLQFNQSRTRYHIHNQFFGATWIRQFDVPRVNLNPLDMETRGLVSGDAVEIVNDRGSAGCEVWANNAIRPGTASVYEGAVSKYMNFGNFQMLTNDTLLERGKKLMMGPVIPFNDTLVEVQKASTIEEGAS
jgi:molybdopterin-containing oxidoreductase family molybdopterin binding subunit